MTDLWLAAPLSSDNGWLKIRLVSSGEDCLKSGQREQSGRACRGLWAQVVTCGASTWDRRGRGRRSEQRDDRKNKTGEERSYSGNQEKYDDKVILSKKRPVSLASWECQELARSQLLGDVHMVWTNNWPLRGPVQAWARVQMVELKLHRERLVDCSTWLKTRGRRDWVHTGAVTMCLFMTSDQDVHGSGETLWPV